MRHYIYMHCILKLLELKVELPMVLKMDNLGAVDIANSWSMGGRTHNVDMSNYFTTSYVNSKSKDYWSLGILLARKKILTC